MSHILDPYALPRYQPQFPPPELRPKVGIIGCGAIVRTAHLPAYKAHGVSVAAAYDLDPSAAQEAAKVHEIGRIWGSADELLAMDDVAIVDIGTHPQHREPLVMAALAAGKHVLTQKPFATDVASAKRMIAEADRRGLKLGVNQNGRWAPAWRAATQLIEAGAIGTVSSVTHLFDVSHQWMVGSKFDEIPHWAIYDYGVHWLDITRCWMGERKPRAVRSREYRPPGQSAGKQAWGMWLEVEYEQGANAFIRDIGDSASRQQGHPFWIHGSEGVLRGSVLGQDYLELEREGTVRRYQLVGKWFNEGFAGAMGEMMSAVVENRQPFNSAAHNLRSLAMTLAACASAERDGQPVSVEE